MMSDRIVRTLWPLRFRGKVRVLSPLVPKAGRRAANVFGTKVSLDLADHVQRMVYLGCFEREETNLMRRELKPGMTFVDIGANCGYFTYLAAARVGASGRVLAVEPSPRVADILEAALRENNLANVTLARTALGRTSGELTLYVPPEALANHAPTAIATPGWSPIAVPVRTLDDLLDEQRIDRVDVLKVDVEGYEGEVLRGAERSLQSGRIRAMLIEFNEWWLRQAGSNSGELWDRILAAGFTCDRPRPANFDIHSLHNVYFRAR
jgi:FkbM family methyltransferase